MPDHFPIILSIIYQDLTTGRDILFCYNKNTETIFSIFGIIGNTLYLIDPAGIICKTGQCLSVRSSVNNMVSFYIKNIAIFSLLMIYILPGRYSSFVFYNFCPFGNKFFCE